MAWNEPGGGDGDKDPWSGKGGDQGPPDLDEVVRKLQEKLGGVFGGGKSSGGGAGGRTPAGPGAAGIGAILFIALLVIAALKGFYIIEPAERGVEMRFGKYHKITEPGPHVLIPFVDEVIKVNVDRISSFRHKAQMLTKDENIVDIELTVQSKVQDPADFLFQDQDPEKTMRDATETAVRESIGKSNLDFILTEGRGSIANTIKQGVQDLVNTYRTGLEITSVNMQPAKPPEQVKSAFDDAIKAREDKERQENQAEAYANAVVPKARGAAARLVEDAKAYRDKVIAEAEGETNRFLAVLTEYEKAPEVTRERLYLETVESVLGNVNKVMLDVEGGNSLMYLPLDKLIESTGATAKGDSKSPSFSVAPRQQSSTDTSSRDSSRSGRRGR